MRTEGPYATGAARRAPAILGTGTTIAGASVLVVDDDAIVLQVIERILASEGVRIQTAITGEDALRLARQGPYDAIVLDLKLPGVSGLQVQQTLRLEGIWTPIVILTGYPDAGSAFASARLGAIHYLQKPARAAELVTAIQQAIGSPARRAHAPGRKSSRLFALSGFGPSDRGRELESVLSAARAARVSRDTLASILARALSEEITLPEFVAAGRALRLIASFPTANADVIVRESLGFLEQAATYDRRPVHHLVGHVLARMEAAAAAWDDRDLPAVGHDLTLTRDAISRLLGVEVGLDLARCRKMVALRRAVLELAQTAEHVKQIGIHAGYDHVPNFNRDFHDHVGMTPTAYRVLLARG